MKSTKILLALFACASIALGTAACNGDDTNPVTNPPKDSGPTADSGPQPGVDSGQDSGPQPGQDAGGDTGTPLPTGLIDRMGRPAINTALNYGDDTKKDSWNHTDTFTAPTKTDWDTNFNTNLYTFDSLAGGYNWTADGGAPAASDVHPLRDPLKLDVLIVDTGIDCTAANNFCEGGYLEIENQLLLGGAAHTTCGGRTPAEDVMDKTLSLLVIKQLSGVSDYVNAATKPPTHTFPYLAAPN